MNIVNCTCLHNDNTKDIFSVDPSISSISYDTAYRINNCCLHYKLPYELIYKIFEYIECTNIYHIVSDTKRFRANKQVCIFGCIYTSYIMKCNLTDCTDYTVILHDIVDINDNPLPIDIYDIPISKLIESNNILAHFIVLIHYTLTDAEIIYLFNTWRQDELEYCTSPISVVLLKTLIPYLKEKYNDNDNANCVLDFLYSIMYNTQDITPLYDIIEHMELKAIDRSIVKQFQIPPFLMEKLINVLDVNDIAVYQLYIDKKIIMDNFSQFTEESFASMIANMASSDEKVLNKIIKYYPQLLTNIIRNDLATIDQLCGNKTTISKEDWVYISQNYDIPGDKILQLSRFLDYKRFLIKRSNLKNNKRISPDGKYDSMAIMQSWNHMLSFHNTSLMGATAMIGWNKKNNEDEDDIEYQMAIEMESHDNNLLLI